MRISQLIAALQTAMDAHGDEDIFVQAVPSSQHYPIVDERPVQFWDECFHLCTDDEEVSIYS